MKKNQINTAKKAQGVRHPRRISLNIDTKTHAAIKKLARKRGISVSEWIREAMSESMGVA